MQGAVVHQNGGSLVAAGQLLDLRQLDAVVGQLLGEVGDVGADLAAGGQDLSLGAVLAQLLVAPAPDLAVVVDGDNVVDTGCDHGDVALGQVSGDLGNVNTGGTDGGGAPDVDVAVVAQAHGEGAVAVDHLDVVLQSAGNGGQLHGGGDVLLGDVGVGVGVLGHEQGADEHGDEHGDQQHHCADGQLAAQEVVDDLPHGADDLFDVSSLGALLGSQVLGSGILVCLLEEGLLLFTHYNKSSFAYLLTRTLGSTIP